MFIFDAGAWAASRTKATLCEREIVAASRKHGIPVGILYSVGLTETGRKGSLQPYALNIEGKTVFAGSLSEALKVFHRARRNGRKLIDLGCMQINHHYHRQEFSDARSMLDPRLNVDYAARFLIDLKRRHKSWTMAVARYHAGPNNNPAQRKYVCRVITNLVATGYGQWTQPARKFCKNN
ncbi:MAG: transglycosylase SLT domain-containing protein [Alphaproteobacteria bacterium]|nr:transglycosylase SLT domain-containing protein [Alphaproteobacteria bacterium]